jgi:hypothetical protein
MGEARGSAASLYASTRGLQPAGAAASQDTPAAAVIVSLSLAPQTGDVPEV